MTNQSTPMHRIHSIMLEDIASVLQEVSEIREAMLPKCVATQLFKVSRTIAGRTRKLAESRKKNAPQITKTIALATMLYG